MSPRLVLPLMSLEARGKLKGLGVFYRKNGQNWLKDFQTYTDSPTLAESFQRLRVRAKVAAWQALPAPEKAAWNDAARARGGTWCGYTLFMKEYTLSGTWYQDLIDACAAAPRAFGSLSDVDDSTKAAGNVPTWSPAAGKWIPAAPAAASPAPFIDNFDDASRHWAWYDHNVAAGKSISESGSALTISVAAGTPSDWWSNSNSAPKAIMSIPSAPCDILTKVNAFTVNDCCQAGLFIAADPIGQGSTYAYFLTFGNTGIGVSASGVASLGSNPSTTLPVWLRIRVLNENKGSFRAIFSFSLDGSSFTDVYTLSGYPILAGKPSCGIFVKNWTGNAISAPFEFFKVIPSAGPSPSAPPAAPAP